MLYKQKSTDSHELKIQKNMIASAGSFSDFTSHQKTTKKEGGAQSMYLRLTKITQQKTVK